jgi:hypothetical protein
MKKLVAVMALLSAQAALAQEYSVGSGIHYSTGTYGESTKTQIVSIPLTGRYDTDVWSFKAVLPYLRISGDSDVVPGAGRVDRRRARDQRVTTGLGDSTLSATYNLYGAGARSGIGLGGKLKLATGDEAEGLGTGSNDVSFQVEGFQAIERNTVFGVLGYTVFGDSPVANFDNVLNAGIGVTHRLATGDSVGLAFDLRQAGTPAPAAQRELTGFWSHKLDRAWRMQAYLLKGFARGSPDWGTGVSAAYAF